MLFVTLFMILFFHMAAIFKKKAQTGMVTDDGKQQCENNHIPDTHYQYSIISTGIRGIYGTRAGTRAGI